MSTRIALVGDFDANVLAHQAIPRAIELAAAAEGADVRTQWLATDTIGSDAELDAFDAFWCVPASPYRSMEGALRAIRFARLNRRPFLGTCGGFQHALVEYARSLPGWSHADHAETSPDAELLVVTPLACSLVEVTGTVRFLEGSRVARAYGRSEAHEGYHCRYGLNPALRAALAAGPLRVTAEDDAGDARAVELDDHPFFLATLFQPERAALRGEAPPVVRAFVRAATQGTRVRGQAAADRG